MNTSVINFDPRELRNAFGTFGTGVTVVTSRNAEGRLVGVTANSFSSVSLEPPIVLWSLVKKSPSLEVFQSSGRFVINILSLDQVNLSKQFSSSIPDKFQNVEYQEGIEGLPVLTGCAGTIECRVIQSMEVGDHILFLGEVENFAYEKKETLLYCNGNYAKSSAI